jgi:hypothetical protein
MSDESSTICEEYGHCILDLSELILLQDAINEAGRLVFESIRRNAGYDEERLYQYLSADLIQAQEQANNSRVYGAVVARLQLREEWARGVVELHDPVETWTCARHPPGFEINYPLSTERCEVCLTPRAERTLKGKGRDAGR